MKKAIAILLLLFIPSAAWSACTYLGGGSWRTAGNEYADVAECVTAASSGDTINVVAGDGAAEWGTKVTISKPLKIIGPGVGNLTVTWTNNNAFYALDIADIRISGFTFKHTVQSASHIAVYLIGCTNFRVDNNAFTNAVTTYQNYSVWVHLSATNTFPYGLVDHNAFQDTKIEYPNGSASQAIWSSLWTSELALGSWKALYVENNTFTNASTHTTGLAIDHNRGSRVVARYNTLAYTYFMAHSYMDAGRGPRSWEYYGNILSSTGYQSNPFYLRGGTGTLFYNSSSGYNYNYIKLFDDRSGHSDALKPPSNNLSWAGKCDGDNVSDMNTDPNPGTGHKDGWPCRDQIGRSTDASTWTTAGTTQGPDQESSPAYLWSNFTGTGSVLPGYVPDDTNVSYDSSVTGLNVAHIKPDRDYYDYTASFDGTTGTGCGTLGNRPATCTTGVAYWATDQSCSDMTNYVGSNPTTTISGVLYKCTAANTWTAYYTPYQYPHPLQATGTSYTVALTKTRTDDADGRLRTTSLDVDLQTTETSESGSVQTGTTLIFEATEYTGMGDFVTWGGDCASCGSNLQCVKTISANTTCSGEFSYGASPPTTYTVSVTKVGNGTGTVVASDASINCGATCTYTYEDSTAVTLSASCTEGGFVGWGGDCSGQSTCSLIMSANKSVTAMCHKRHTVGSGPAVTVGSGPGITIY